MASRKKYLELKREFETLLAEKRVLAKTIELADHPKMALLRTLDSDAQRATGSKRPRSPLPRARRTYAGARKRSSPRRRC